MKHEREKLETSGTHLDTGIVQANKDEGAYCDSGSEMKEENT